MERTVFQPCAGGTEGERQKRPVHEHAVRIALGSAGALLALIAIAALVAGLAMRSGAAQHERNPEAHPSTGSEADRTIDWNYWKGVNPDVVAWLEIPGTGIDAPVVQAPADDPGFYLNHDVYRNWNLWGSVYVDAACEDGINSRNVVVLGHNMGDGTMLGPLEQYRDEQFAKGHAQAVLYTPESTATLRIMASETIDGTRPVKQTSFANQLDFATYRAATLKRCDVVVDKRCASALSPRLFTLCTCSYFVNPDNERTLVYAQ